MVRRMPKDSITKIVPQRGREIFDLISALLERLEWKCSSQGVNQTGVEMQTVENGEWLDRMVMDERHVECVTSEEDGDE